jgi:prolyl-tRNA synthetase
MAGNSVFVARRDRAPSSKESLPRDAFVSGIPQMLDDIQNVLFERARAHREANTRPIDGKDEFYAFFTPPGGNAAEGDRQEIHGGFALTHWSGDPAIEQRLKAELGVTLRCIPLAEGDGPGTCPFSGKPSKKRVVWAKAY